MPIARQETGLSLSRASQGPGDQPRPADGAVLYKGNCHCGRVRFEVKLPEMSTATTCNCSLCHKSGYLWAFPHADNIRYLKGQAEALAMFETEALEHEVSTWNLAAFWTILCSSLADKI